VFERHLLSIHFMQSQREWGMFHLLTGVLQHSLAEINSCELDVIGIVRKVSTSTYTHFENITMKIRKKLFPPFIPNHFIHPIVNAGNAIVSFFDNFISIRLHFTFPHKMILISLHPSASIPSIDFLVSLIFTIGFPDEPD